MNMCYVTIYWNLELECMQDIENVTYKQWIQTDRSSLDTLIKMVDEFIDSLIQKLNFLTQHHYIQSTHLKVCKETLSHTLSLLIFLKIAPA